MVMGMAAEECDQSRGDIMRHSMLQKDAHKLQLNQIFTHIFLARIAASCSCPSSSLDLV